MNPDYEAKLKQCDLLTLLRLLTEIEGRLGTGLEVPGDLECAQAIAHQLNNHYTTEKLLESLKTFRPKSE